MIKTGSLKTATELAAENTQRQINELNDVVKNYINEKAQAKGYDNIASAIDYASDTPITDDVNAERYRTEGNAHKLFKSKAWSYIETEFAKTQLAESNKDHRVLPTKDELIIELDTNVPAP